MATEDDVQKLAGLARIRVEESELEKLASEFESILAYVSKLEDVEVPQGGQGTTPVRNVVRPDAEPHAPGAYTEALTQAFPEREGDLLKVKQIISHD